MTSYMKTYLTDFVFYVLKCLTASIIESRFVNYKFPQTNAFI